MSKELHFHPDFTENKKLDAEELAEIFEAMLPLKWQEDMVEHDCTAMNSKLKEISDFAERMELRTDPWNQCFRHPFIT